MLIGGWLHIHVWYYMAGRHAFQCRECDVMRPVGINDPQYGVPR
jgi:hypothetical protein